MYIWNIQESISIEYIRHWSESLDHQTKPNVYLESFDFSLIYQTMEHICWKWRHHTFKWWKKGTIYLQQLEPFLFSFGSFIWFKIFGGLWFSSQVMCKNKEKREEGKEQFGFDVDDDDDEHKQNVEIHTQTVTHVCHTFTHAISIDIYIRMVISISIRAFIWAPMANSGLYSSHLDSLTNYY